MVGLGSKVEKGTTFKVLYEMTWYRLTGPVGTRPRHATGHGTMAEFGCMSLQCSMIQMGLDMVHGMALWHYGRVWVHGTSV